MAGFIDRVLARLREDSGFSRNRHYLALSSPEGKRALRIHRHLRSIERDLARGCHASVEHEPDRIRLTLRRKGLERVAWLTRAEFRLLCSTDEVRAALGLGPAS
jgi:hypothetical protein